MFKPYVNKKPMPNLMPAIYSHRIADIQAIARDAGYAIAVHGSMQNDLDIIAVPWVEHPAEPAELVNRMCPALSLAFDPTNNPVQKPHGRLVWSLVYNGIGYIDFSVMTPTPDEQE